jgi:hypothetical protein
MKLYNAQLNVQVFPDKLQSHSIQSQIIKQRSGQVPSTKPDKLQSYSIQSQIIKENNGQVPSTKPDKLLLQFVFTDQ